MNVYCITFPNGKRYVGVESRTGDRKNHHKIAKSNQLVHVAIRKYGWSNCNFEYLIMNKTPEECWVMEKRLIAEWRLQDRGFGYNVSAGGESGGFGIKHLPERRYRQSLANLGKKRSLESKKQMSINHTGKLNYFWGQKHTPESILKIKIKRANQICSAETREKLSLAAKQRWQKQKEKYGTAFAHLGPR